MAIRGIAFLAKTPYSKKLSHFCAFLPAKNWKFAIILENGGVIPGYEGRIRTAKQKLQQQLIMTKRLRCIAVEKGKYL